MAYPDHILSTRAVIRHGNYAIIPPTGLVNNVVPGIEGCQVSILASPESGASFVQYAVEAGKGGGTTRPFAAEPGIESFVYCINGNGTVSVGGEERKLFAGNM